MSKVIYNTGYVSIPNGLLTVFRLQFALHNYVLLSKYIVLMFYGLRVIA